MVGVGHREVEDVDGNGVDDLTGGQEAGAGIARRGQEASEELAQRLESLERRLLALEDAVRTRSNPKRKD